MDLDPVITDYFSHDICATVYVSIDKLAIRGAVETSLDTSATKRRFLLSILPVDGHLIQIQSTRLAGIGLFSKRHENARLFSLVIDHINQLCMGNRGEFLVVDLSNIHTLLPVWIATYNDMPCPSAQALADNPVADFMEVIMDG